MSEEKLVSNLDRLARKLQTLLAREATNQQDWVAIQMDVCRTLAEARDEFTADIEFGRWCESNGFGKNTLSKEKRAAAITMGREPEALRKCLEATERGSLETIYKFDFARFRNVPKPTSDEPSKSRRRKSPTPKSNTAREAVRPLVEADLPVSRTKLSERLGVGKESIQRAIDYEQGRLEGLSEAAAQVEPIARDNMSPTMQQRYDAALRTARKEIEAEVTVRLKAEIHAVWDGIIEHYNKRVAEADRIIESYRGVMTRDEFKLLLASLHPDHNKFEGAKDAFIVLKNLEAVLVKPDIKLISGPPLPKTVAELLARKKVKAGV